MTRAQRANPTPEAGDDAVRRATGKTWQQWFKLIDAAGGRQWDHKRIVAYLNDEHGVGPWWRQMVTVGYERARGKRVLHQKPDGFSISRSKTLPAPAAALFEAWHDGRQRARWLADPKVTIRAATPGRSLRITWVDGKSSVEVMLYPKAAGKTQLTVQHNKLADAKAAARMKAYWGAQLDALAALVGG
jgi:uncharacterized protein YndB with AHSA1/START domain